MEWQDPARVEMAARIRCQRLGKDQVEESDRAMARKDLHFWWMYRPIAIHKLVGDSKVYLGVRERRVCRYCKLDESATSFKYESHAFPEFLGNKCVIDREECDSCNKRFSETCEDHLDKLTQPFRTMFAVKGKRGVPSFKDRVNGIRIDFRPGEMAFDVVTNGESEGWQVDDEKRRITVKLSPQPYIPLEAFRCLVKMGYALAPEQCRPNLDRVRRWLVDPVSITEPVERWAMCLHAFCKQGFPEPWAALLERTKADGRSPHLLFLVGSATLLLQIAMPLSLRDRHLENREDNYMPQFDIESHFQTEGCHWDRLLLCSADATREPTFRYEMSTQGSVALPDSPTPEMLKKFESLK